MEGSVYLEDLHVGQRFESATHVVTTDEIKAFARQFDPQPFHLDEEAAARSLLGGLAASGWHTAALTMRLLVGGGAPIAGGVVGAGVEIKWPRPVRPGDELQVFSEVTEITPSRSNARPRHRRPHGARPATSAARPCRSSRRSWWCRAGRAPSVTASARITVSP